MAPTRRSILRGLGSVALTAPLWRPPAHAALPKMKITRVRFYESPISREMTNQSFNVVTIETDAGLTGIGEGGRADLVAECAGLLIGEDPSRIDRLWQLMYRGLFYPAGREKLHAIGALDLALWDLKGKALGVPVYELLGGRSRDHVECYATGWSEGKTPRERARACMEAGFRAIRLGPTGPGPNGYETRMSVRETFKLCEETAAGVGKDGEWCIDFHTRFDLADAIRLCTLLEPLEPMFCEDIVRSENPAAYKTLRPMVKVPLAVGEQFGDRWEFNEFVEQRLCDYSRVTLPNCGGITEFMKIAALCETHYVALAPHFTGPIAETALVHCCGVFSGPVVMELAGGGKYEAGAYLPQSYDQKKGKLYLNQRPGLGLTLDTKPLTLTAEVTESRRPEKVKNKLLTRPDGSFTNW